MEWELRVVFGRVTGSSELAREGEDGGVKEVTGSVGETRKPADSSEVKADLDDCDMLA